MEKNSSQYLQSNTGGGKHLQDSPIMAAEQMASDSSMVSPMRIQGTSFPTGSGTTLSEETHMDISRHEAQKDQTSQDEEKRLTWKQVDQLASWVFEIPMPSDSEMESANHPDKMSYLMQKVSGCLENLSPDDEEIEDREEQLLYERISRKMPTTVLVHLAPDDIESLPDDYYRDDDAIHDVSDIQTIPLQVWRGNNEHFRHDAEIDSLTSDTRSSPLDKKDRPRPESHNSKSPTNQTPACEQTDQSEPVQAEATMDQTASPKHQSESRAQLIDSSLSESEDDMESSHSDDSIDATGQSVYTMFHCSLDDATQQGPSTNTQQDIDEHSDHAYSSDSDIFTIETSRTSSTPTSQPQAPETESRQTGRKRKQIDRGSDNTDKTGDIMADKRVRKTSALDQSCDQGSEDDIILIDDDQSSPEIISVVNIVEDPSQVCQETARPPSRGRSEQSKCIETKTDCAASNSAVLGTQSTSGWISKEQFMAHQDGVQNSENCGEMSPQQCVIISSTSNLDSTQIKQLSEELSPNLISSGHSSGSLNNREKVTLDVTPELFSSGSTKGCSGQCSNESAACISDCLLQNKLSGESRCIDKIETTHQAECTSLKSGSGASKTLVTESCNQEDSDIVIDVSMATQSSQDRNHEIDSSGVTDRFTQIRPIPSSESECRTVQEFPRIPAVSQDELRATPDMVLSSASSASSSSHSESPSILHSVASKQRSRHRQQISHSKQHINSSHERDLGQHASHNLVKQTFRSSFPVPASRIYMGSLQMRPSSNNKKNRNGTGSCQQSSTVTKQVCESSRSPLNPLTVSNQQSKKQSKQHPKPNKKTLANKPNIQNSDSDKLSEEFPVTSVCVRTSPGWVSGSVRSNPLGSGSDCSDDHHKQRTVILSPHTNISDEDSGDVLKRATPTDDEMDLSPQCSQHPSCINKGIDLTEDPPSSFPSSSGESSCPDNDEALLEWCGKYLLQLEEYN